MGVMFWFPSKPKFKARRKKRWIIGPCNLINIHQCAIDSNDFVIGYSVMSSGFMLVNHIKVLCTIKYVFNTCACVMFSKKMPIPQTVISF